MDASERTLRLFGIYFPLSRLAFHTPVYFFFLAQRFGVDDVLRLSAIYYLAVVVLEVPSGYLSDRLGRVGTLRVSSLAKLAAYGLFLAGGTRFEIHAAAEIMLALHWACISGTDTSLHFDALEALGRTDEYGARESRLARNGFRSAAASVLVGGAVGFFDLGAAYLVGAVGAVGSLVVTLLMREPPRDSEGFSQVGFFRQVGECTRALRDPVLAWISFYVLTMLVLEHIPFEFGQPYLALVLGETADDVTRTPLASGGVYAGVYAVASVAAHWSMTVRTRLGVGGALVGVTALQTAVIAAMAMVVHPVVLGLLLLRSVQPAISQPIVNAACSPRLPASRRATFFSLQSLAGRLGYGVVLLGLAGLAGDATGDAQTVGRLLETATLLAIAALAALLLGLRAVRPRDGGG